ncbi:hypothetical protein B0A55_00736 [Friedmanniomyces simplex]|uniref:BTB domain-containing protein n=1 Tax=Friedmanniomyces simplex TaxID=329884 RepID=A0A4U0XXV8_9PEZI|nr:hypothetical protein B0A55_00736 [Friedmanniomyces simplex]
MSPPSIADRFPSSTDLDTLVTVNVGKGESQRTFQAHKGVLAFYSGYFDTALNGRFREATDGAGKLTTEDPTSFDIFLRWAYTRRFRESPLDPTVLNAVIGIFALKLRGPMLRPERDTIDCIWENSLPGTALRKLVIDFVSMLVESVMPLLERLRSGSWSSRGLATQACTLWYVEGETDINDFLHERPPLNPKTRQWEAYGIDRCRWHVHEGRESCVQATKAPKGASSPLAVGKILIMENWMGVPSW